MKLGDYKLRKVTETDFLKKFQFSQNLGKWTQNGPKFELFGFFSILALMIFFKIGMLLEVNSGLILAKTACSENSSSGVTVPKVLKSTFFQSCISRQRVEQIEICFDFWEV